MRQLDTADARIVYADEGEGDATLLLHGSLSADWFLPVSRRLVEDGYRVLRVHRAGYGRSEDLAGGVGVAAHAEHAAQVLEAAGVQRAHIVGHSAGGSIALQLAHARPDLVRSLVLLEAAFPSAPNEPKNPAIPRAVEVAREGDYERAFDVFLDGVCGPGFREVLVRQLGEDGLRDALASSRYFFTAELAAFVAWPFGSAEAAAITAPVLLVVSEQGVRLNRPNPARSAQLATWLPHSETHVLPGVSHAMPLEDPALVARTIRAFIASEAGRS